MAEYDPDQLIEFANLRFGPEEIIEMDGSRPAVRVRRPDVRRITFRQGLYSAHPVAQVMAGLVLTAVGVLPTIHLAHWLVSGGTFFEAEAFLVMFLFLGPWLVYDAVKRGPHLAIESAAGRKVLIFRPGADVVELEQGLDAVQGRLGYAIERGSTAARPLYS